MKKRQAKKNWKKKISKFSTRELIVVEVDDVNKIIKLGIDQSRFVVRRRK